MADLMIQKIWQSSYGEYDSSGRFQSDVQRKASLAILNCKSGKLGCNLSVCPDCGHMEIHNNSCRNRNCPNCQAVQKEFWVDNRRAEVIDSPYFHVVFTLPHELNPLLYCNQALLYGLFHRCCADTLLELICAPFRFSENPVLWVPEQPGQNKKLEIDLYTAGTSEVQSTLYRSDHSRTAESRMEC